MTTTADRPAALDHEDAQNIARRVVLDALHEHTGTVEHGRVWTLVREDHRPLTRNLRDGVQVTAEEYGTGQRVQVTVFVGGGVLS